MRCSGAAAFVFLTLFLATCRKAVADDARLLGSLESRVVLTAPTDWNLLAQENNDSIARYVFHVPNSAADSTAAERTNVVVTFRVVPPGDFQERTDSLFGAMADSTLILLEERTPTAETRYFFWRGQSGRTVYAGYDDFARERDILRADCAPTCRKRVDVE